MNLAMRKDYSGRGHGKRRRGGDYDRDPQPGAGAFGVTTVHGNLPLPYTTDNTLRVMDL